MDLLVETDARHERSGEAGGVARTIADEIEPAGA
jgi:hypothetical protein